MNWYELKDSNQVDSPALLVFPQRVKQNIRTAIDMVGDVDRLRPHIKTHKSSGPIKLMIAAGINKFKCATIAEAELLGIEGAKDVLLAYQPIGPKLDRFKKLILKYPSTKYSCLVDNLDAAQQQSESFAASGLKVQVYIDLNVGMNRTGIIPDKKASELFHYLNSADGIIAAGLHAYDGHIRDADISLRTKACDEAFASVTKLKTELEREGLKVGNIIAGGSPTFPIHAKRTEVECSPGTFVYWDKGYLDGCPEQRFVPAAVLITRVISLISDDRICTDLGHKSVAAENELSRRIHFLNADGLIPTGQSEEHLVLQTTKENKFNAGDLLYGMPFHICPTVALYERVITIDDHTVTGEWKTEARDRCITV